MGKLAIIYLGVALSSPAFAQSASNFDPAPSHEAKPSPGTENGVKPALGGLGKVDSTPSRLIGPAEIESYVKSISSQFLMKNRVRDPFGLTQNPEAVPLNKPSNFGNGAVATKQATPFSQIVPLIAVTMIMPREKMFLYGSRPFRQGELIPLKYQGKQLRVQIMEVSSQQITFRNLDTGETASRKLNGLPAGFSPGGQKSAIPGMTPNRTNAPIELDAGDSAP